MIGEAAFAFGAGSVATVNPCGFALLPAYLARRLAIDDGAPDPAAAVGRALGAGAAMTGGFLLVFAVGGGAFALGAEELALAFPWAGLAIGLLLAAAGVATMAGWRVGVRLPRRLGGPPAAGWRGDLAYGLGYGVVSLSCTLPVFLAVAGTATTGGAAVTAASVAAYALGMGTVVTALGVAAALSRRGIERMARGALPHVRRIGGALLLLAGAYVAYFWSSGLFFPAASLDGGLLVAGERVSGTLRAWVGGTTGQTVLYGLLAALAGVPVWLARRRTRARGRGVAAAARARAGRRR